MSGLRSRRLRPRLLMVAAALAILVWALLPGHTWDVVDAASHLDCTNPGFCRYAADISRVDPTTHGTTFHLTTNWMGFRGPAADVKRADPNTLRVQLYGDGNVFGIGVGDDETLPAALQAELRGRIPGRPIEVANFALPANYTVSNLRVYAAMGRPFEPDIVIFCQPRLTAQDMNWRIRRLQNSKFLNWLQSMPRGSWLVNYWLSKLPNTSAAVEIEQSMKLVLDDQRSRGLKVYLFAFWEEGGAGENGVSRIEEFKQHMPAGLDYGIVTTGMQFEEYRASRFAQPGDAKPTAEAQGYFAKLIADRMLSDLEKSKKTPNGANRSN